MYLCAAGQPYPGDPANRWFRFHGFDGVPMLSLLGFEGITLQSRPRYFLF